MVNSDDVNSSAKNAVCGANINLLPQAYPHLTGVTDKFQSVDEFNWSLTNRAAQIDYLTPDKKISSKQRDTHISKNRVRVVTSGKNIRLTCQVRVCMCVCMSLNQLGCEAG